MCREGGSRTRWIWHFDARIMDLAPAAAIVKKNKRLSKRPSQEFNAAHEKTGKIQQHSGGAAECTRNSKSKRLVEGESGRGVDSASDSLVSPSRVAD